MRERSTQKDLERIGKEGCYFLSLVAAIERTLTIHMDIYQVYLDALAARFIEDNCFVNSPEKIITVYLGGMWVVLKESATYQTNPGEIEILRYERIDGMTNWAHFVLGDGAGQVAYDPYGASATVRLGKLVSKRILRRV